MKLIFKIFKKVRDLKREERAIEKGRLAYIDKLEEYHEHKDKQIESVYERLEKRNQELDQREQELNELQQKINDQILKLGIVKGVNK